MIWIQLDSEDDAYVIFETLNSRGRDWETVDPLKNLLLSAIKAENGDLDSARPHWAEMRESLSGYGAGANPNKLILHWWLSRNDYTAERKLFRLIRKKTDKAEAPTLLASLKNDAALYTRIANPAAWPCQVYEEPANCSLLALNLVQCSSTRPFILALLRAQHDGLIKVGRLKSALRSVECYHFVTTAIVGSVLLAASA